MANIIIKSHRDGYNIKQVEKTMSVGELIAYLQNFNEEDKLYVSHDGGYMYSGVCEEDFIN